jgi:hypothetical protein
MSLTEEQPITCPACGQTSKGRIARSVNVATDPSAKEQVLTGRLFAFTCPACQRTSRVVHPELLYQDLEKELLVQLDALGKLDVASLKHFESALPKITRVVRDSNALLEKVKIVDAGLDDRVIEVLKAVLAEQSASDTPSRHLFEGTGTPSAPTGTDLRFTLLSAKGVSGVAVPRSAYDGLAAKLSARGALRPAPPWAVIDAAYARLLLTV